MDECVVNLLFENQYQNQVIGEKQKDARHRVDTLMVFLFIENRFVIDGANPLVPCPLKLHPWFSGGKFDGSAT